MNTNNWKDFKIFENRDIAYLDSGATSQRPYQVLKAVRIL